VQTAVSLLNLGGRRLGRAPGAEDERDLEQVRDAIDAVRGLMPVLEREAPGDLGPLRDALSQLQLAYAREAQTEADRPPSQGQPGGGEPAPTGAQGEPGGATGATGGKPGSSPDEDQRRPGPAESSGRLWVPGS
jgi:hypothetical protein